MSDIKITIGGDIIDLEQKLSKAKSKVTEFSNATSNTGKAAGQSLFNLTEKLRGFQDAVFTEKDRNKISLYNQQIRATQAEITKLNSLGTSGGGGAFSGITTGASKAFSAVRQLAYILPGVGIAGIIGFATEPIIKYVSSLFGASEAEKQLAEDNKKFAESLDEVRSKGIATGLQLQNFVAIARDQTQSLSTRNDALREANKILGEHGEKLTLVNIATAAVTAEINKFTEATIQQALAAKFADRAADLIIKQRDAIKEYTKAKNEQTVAIIASKNAAGSTEEYVSAKANEAVGFTEKRAKAAKAYIAITQQLKDVVTQLGDAQLASAQLFGDVGFKPDKVKADVETISSVLAKLQRQLQLLKVEGDLFKVDKTKEQISAIEAAIKHLVEKFKVSPDDTIIKKLFGDIDALNLPGFLKQLSDSARKERGVVVPVFFDEFEAQRELADTLEKLIPKGIKIGTNIFGSQDIELNNKVFFSGESINALKQNLINEINKLNDPKNQDSKIKLSLDIDVSTIGELTKVLDKSKADLEKYKTDIQGIMKGIVVDTLVSIGEGIGQLAVGGGFGDFFTGIAKTLGNGLKALGRYLIETYTYIGILQKIKFSNPYVGIAIGVLLTALGSVISTKLSKTSAFASGVRSFGGGFATVGERGPERVFLPSGASVQPNNEVNAFGGGGSAFIAETRISGQDLIIMLARAQKTMDRNN